ncbi:SPASM domain-containing protein [Paenibacillus polymyxa]|uniref:radical SAM/SPASM domain-containing protein n=1 Tax=Paenibacillus polymyxa TaxID=1406 RepID=UPI001BE72BB4|nr:radical SAM/SPASM domain-containing protein [Paenibacillus polymyxa]MBT2282948.1 SPASM domain-containing protein [Paenibacillus polymyxa]
MMDMDFIKQMDKEHAETLSNEGKFQYYESLRSKLPFVEQIETTNLCDCTCQMCPRGVGMMNRKLGAMSMEMYTTIVDEIHEHFPNGYQPKNIEKRYSFEDVVSIDFETTGLRLHHFGEPLLDKLLPERVAYAKENSNVDVHFSVNPTRLTPDLSIKLIKSGLKRLIIALDGTNDEEYKSIRGKRVDYDTAVKNIEELIRIKKEEKSDLIIDLQMISMKQTKLQVEQFRKYWEGMGLNVYIKHFFPYPDVDHNEFTIEDEGNFKRGCMFPFTSMTIMRDGSVVPCCSDYNGEITLGNVNEQSLKEIWNGENYTQFRKNFITNNLSEDSLCRRCGFYEFKD